MFIPLQKILPSTIKGYGLKRQIDAAIVCEKYRKLAPTLVHPQILTFTIPKFFRDKTLTVGVESGAWAQQIKMHEKELVEAMNKVLGKDTVMQIRTAVLEKEIRENDVA